MPPRLVRVQDRLTRDSDTIWRINPRTGFLESRAGLSWTGVREYRTPQGLLRVLRRPEQVNSPGHLRTLRRLPCCDGHPDGGRDVAATNVTELGVGWTGDAIAIEDLRGYPRPVGDVSVSRLATIAKMLPREVWEQYLADFPEAAKASVRHDGGAPRTGTSLGYNALWYGPYVDSEIVSERDDGSLVGAWQGPRGPEQYDVEHIVDPECEVVQRLAANTGFNPALLGGNHFAVALAALGGRGAEQSELMRVVDSAELPIAGDLARRSTRVALQVPRMAATRDANWTVGASRELNVVPGDWDGDKAAASVFAWAGFDGESPDPAKARQAFLVYDADAPDVRASYKLPIAEHRDGGLVVVKGGLDAAASYLPQTDAPKEVLDRARDVLDHYYAKWDESEKQGAAAARDALPQREKIMTTKINVEFGIGRDNAKALAKLAPQRRLPETLILTLDEGPDTKALMGKLAEMQEVFGDLMEMVGTAKSEAAAAEGKMADMVSVAEATKKVDEIKAALAEAEKALAEAKAGEEKAAAERDAVRQTADALTAELAPLRAAAFKRFQDDAIARGFDKAGVEQCKDAAQLRRAIVAAKVGERYAKMRDDNSTYVLGDDLVQAAFDALWTVTTPVPAQPKPKQTSDSDDADGKPSATFAGFPRVVVQRDANPNNEPAPTTNTAAHVKAGMAGLG